MKATWELVAELYGAHDTEAAVRSLADLELVAVRGYIARDYNENGVSGLLLGVCLVEEAGRFERLIKEGGEI